MDAPQDLPTRLSLPPSRQFDSTPPLAIPRSRLGPLQHPQPTSKSLPARFWSEEDPQPSEDDDVEDHLKDRSRIVDAYELADLPAYIDPDPKTSRPRSSTIAAVSRSQTSTIPHAAQPSQQPQQPRQLPPTHPSRLQRHLLTLHLSLSSLLSLSCASAPSPLLPHLSRLLTDPTTEPNIKPPSSALLTLLLSIYFLSLGLAPLLIAPLSESPLIGRRPILLCSLGVFSVANALTPLPAPGSVESRPNVPLILIMRFIAGLGAAAPIVLSGPTMRDLYPDPKQRGHGLALVGGAVYLGPAVGPIIFGGVLGRFAGWRWMFWGMALCGAVLLGAGWWFSRETSVVRLMYLEERRLAEAEGSKDWREAEVWAAHSRRELKRSLLRPVRILIQRPILQIVALLNGLGFGLYVIVLSTFATLYIEEYGQSAATASLHYVAIAIGASIACQGSGRLMDVLCRRMSLRYADSSGKSTPEFRIPLLTASVIIIPFGLLWYGWAAQSHAHWAAVDIAVASWCIGIFANAQMLVAYTLDEFGAHTASASAASKFWGYLAGFLFPLFAPSLYKHLGYGIGNTILAVIFTAVTWPVPWILWRYGPQIRSIRWWSSNRQETKAGWL